MLFTNKSNSGVNTCKRRHAEHLEDRSQGKAAPKKVKDALRLASVRNFSPVGNFEQDDMDNWQACTETCRGVVSRRVNLNYQMGMGRDRFNEDLGAWASDAPISEVSQRNFYGRWAKLMA